MRVNISKSIQGVPSTISRNFTFNTRSYGMMRATIYLSSSGEYSLTVNGLTYSQYEDSAKRSAQYKSSLLQISSEMQKAIYDYNESFVQLAQRAPRPIHRTVIEEQLNRLVLKRYKRDTFNLPQPSKLDIEAELKEEAHAKFFSVWKSNTSQIDQYVSDHIENEYNQRIANWDKLKEYHESIQDHLEQLNNKQFLSEYNAAKKKIEDELYGDVAFVQKKFNELPSKCSLPFDISLECDYDKKNGIIDAVASFPTSPDIPIVKVTTFASGKIGIKEKLKREADADKTKTLLGLSYYLAGHLFSLSVNVNIVRLSLKIRYHAYYWVEFDRKSFTRNSLYGISPLQDFFQHPNVIDFKKSNIELIAEDEFNLCVKNAIKVADALAGNNDLTVLPLKEAEKICKIIEGADDLMKAVKEAKAEHANIVVANKRYQVILNELNSIDNE